MGSARNGPVLSPAAKTESAQTSRMANGNCSAPHSSPFRITYERLYKKRIAYVDGSPIKKKHQTTIASADHGTTTADKPYNARASRPGVFFQQSSCLDPVQFIAWVGGRLPGLDWTCALAGVELRRARAQVETLVRVRHELSVLDEGGRGGEID